MGERFPNNVPEQNQQRFSSRVLKRLALPVSVMGRIAREFYQFEKESSEANRRDARSADYADDLFDKHLEGGITLQEALSHVSNQWNNVGEESVKSLDLEWYVVSTQLMSRIIGHNWYGKDNSRRPKRFRTHQEISLKQS